MSRLEWDSSLDKSKYIIGYLERFDGIKEMPAHNWISDTTNEEWIPLHRIKYFKRVDENGVSWVVWDREKRIDKIFGSGWNTADGTDFLSEYGGVWN